MRPHGYASPGWKTAVDRFVSVVLVIVLLLPMLAIGAATLLDSGWPVIIRQRRIGQFGNEYRMLKFRTLSVGTAQVAKSHLGAANMRTTSLGRFLRRYSLDELPQLLNVCAGEMSLIGPRPALYNQYDLTDMRNAAGVLAAKPGLTGLAQVSGREDLPLHDKVALDAKYVRSMSPWLDLRIALLTVRAVLRPRGSF
jgi:O-antigen biosynthesis protein WbqP